MSPGAVALESRIPEKVRGELLSRGHRLFVTSAWSLNSSGGIHIDWSQPGGIINAAADPRVFSTALAW
jgi:gamma-glutamyltranspeptidase / glutathione hydrolase